MIAYGMPSHYVLLWLNKPEIPLNAYRFSPKTSKSLLLRDDLIEKETENVWMTSSKLPSRVWNFLDLILKQIPGI